VQGMVLAGLGFAVMPEYSVTRPGLLTRPLVRPSVERTIGAVAMRDPHRSPAIDAFLTAARGWQWEA